MAIKKGRPSTKVIGSRKCRPSEDTIRVHVKGVTDENRSRLAETVSLRNYVAGVTYDNGHLVVTVNFNGQLSESKRREAKAKLKAGILRDIKHRATHPTPKAPTGTLQPGHLAV